jgi:activator of 2-hydroxyglutaryl-CoA dehydratase
MTASRPIEAVKQGLLEVGRELGDRVITRHADWLSRHMTGEFFGADIIRNEITSHAKAAFVCPEADVYLNGGQDAVLSPSRTAPSSILR